MMGTGNSTDIRNNSDKQIINSSPNMIKFRVKHPYNKFDRLIGTEQENHTYKLEGLPGRVKWYHSDFNVPDHNLSS